MNGWSSGYVTDIDYTTGFYRELTPAILSFAALLSSAVGPNPNDKLTYCELGCGQGYSANLLAAANPHIEVYANDFNPSHIFGARSLVAAAGTRNVHFSDSSFAEFAAEPDLPQFDVVALHGIYSWISAENRAHIVEFIRNRLKPGGLLYISYNTMPGWAVRMPIRRLMTDFAEAASGPTAVRVEQALASVQRLIDLEPAFFKAIPGLADRFKEITQQNRNYLAHEYFNRDLTPFYFGDVAKELGEAKLTFIGSAHLLDGLDAINFNESQQDFLNATSSRIERETMRDYLLNQQFRRDIFMKGPIQLMGVEARERWQELRFALTTRREDVPLKVGGGLGEATLQDDVYNPLLDALANGPATVAQLLTDPKVEAIGLDRVYQGLMVLVGSGHLQPALDEAGDAARVASTRAFNLAVLNKARSSGALQFLASPVTGGAVSLDQVAQLFLLGVIQEQADVPAFAWEILSTANVKLEKNGTALETAEDNLAELRTIFGGFAERHLPLLKSLGII